METIVEQSGIPHPSFQECWYTSGLNLFLNVDIHELVDPKGLAQDVSDVGHWGKGDVRVSLTDATKLLPVMALVRQAFEVQMGEGVNLERPVNETAWLGVAD